VEFIRFEKTKNIDFEEKMLELKQIQSYKQDEKKTIIDSIKEEKYIERVRQLSGASPIHLENKDIYTLTRYTYSPVHTQSAYWAGNLIKNFGLTIEYQNFTLNGRKTQNVIMKQLGIEEPSKIIVIGGHYDSISEIPNDKAPGAVDDGSGTAAVLVLAEIFSQYKFKKTIHFIGFSGEEQGLFGSAHYVDVAKKTGLNVESALISDMTCYSNNYFGVKIEGTRSFTTLMDLVEKNTKEFGTQLQISKSYNSFGSDHVPFQRAGIPAILVIELDDTNYPNYHRSTDTFQNCNAAQAVEIAKGIAGAAIDLAGLV